MTEITTRNARAEDKNFLRELKFAAMRQYVEIIYGWDAALQEELFEKDFRPESIQIIRYHDQDAGMFELQERADYWFLLRIEILPALQNRGIGTVIIKRLIDIVAESTKPLRLQVFKVNPARKLYERLGFVYTGDSETHFTMELPADCN